MRVLLVMLLYKNKYSSEGQHIAEGTDLSFCSTFSGGWGVDVKILMLKVMGKHYFSLIPFVSLSRIQNVVLAHVCLTAAIHEIIVGGVSHSLTSFLW